MSPPLTNTPMIETKGTQGKKRTGDVGIGDSEDPHGGRDDHEREERADAD